PIRKGRASEPQIVSLIDPDQRAAAAFLASALRSFAVVPSILAIPPRALPVASSMLAYSVWCQHYPQVRGGRQLSSCEMPAFMHNAGYGDNVANNETPRPLAGGRGVFCRRRGSSSGQGRGGYITETSVRTWLPAPNQWDRPGCSRVGPRS